MEMPVVSLVVRKPEPMMWHPNPEQHFLKIFLEISELVLSIEDAQGTMKKELTLHHMNWLIPSARSPQQCKQNIKSLYSDQYNTLLAAHRSQGAAFMYASYNRYFTAHLGD